MAQPRRRDIGTRGGSTSLRHLLTDDRRVTVPVAATVAAGVLGTIGTIAWLLVLAGVIDAVFLGGDDLADVTTSLVLMVTLLVVRSGCAWAGEVLGERASARLRDRVRSQLVGHLFAVGPAGMSSERAGEVAATVGDAVEALHDYVTRYVPAVALGLVGPLLVLGTIMVLDPWTTLILLFAGPMLVLLLAVIGGRTRALTRRRLDELGWLSAFYLDMIRGLGTLKAFGRSRQGEAMIERASTRLGDTTMDVLRTAFQTSLVMEWAATAATALVAVEVSFRMIVGDLPFGTALAVLVLTPEFFVPFRRLALEYHAGHAGDAALRRIDELLALPTTTVREPGPPPDRVAVDAVRLDGGPAGPGDSAAPDVELRDVSYVYPGATSAALCGLDLRLEAGRSVALVGPSGAGKTTVARLLLRFMEPTSGTFLVDGRPVEEMDVRQWRRRIAWVPQNPTLLAGTVADNIRLGDPAASDEAVRAAVEVAGATDFIGDLPHGVDTVLGEQGLRLSGGQRQRLAIARAALRNAPLVVLDEYTAHLDDDTESEIVEAIAALLRGRTALVIAHRERTARAADRIVALPSGVLQP